MFSKACEYGIRAVIYIALRSMEGRRVKISDVAENAGSPVAFTAKVLAALTRKEIVQSNTGPSGGFFIPPERMTEISLKDIVLAIDGDELFTVCGLGLRACSSENPCPVHHKFFHIREQIRCMLTETSIKDLALGVKSGESILNL